MRIQILIFKGLISVAYFVVYYNTDNSQLVETPH